MSVSATPAISKGIARRLDRPRGHEPAVLEQGGLRRRRGEPREHRVVPRVHPRAPAGVRGGLPRPRAWSQVLRRHRERQPAHRPWPADVSARDRHRRAAPRSGFVLINEIIWSKDGTGGKWGSWGKQRPIFGSYPYPPNFLFKNVHEYIIIVAKPPKKRTNGKTVLPYAELMELDAHNGVRASSNGH